MQQQVYHSPVYHSQSIQAWEQRWFAKKNSSYGLMQQVAWSIVQCLIPLFIEENVQKVAVCCGQGNNAGDGYLVGKYLQQAGFEIEIYAAEKGGSQDLASASQEALDAGIKVYPHFDLDRKSVV